MKKILTVLIFLLPHICGAAEPAALVDEFRDAVYLQQEDDAALYRQYSVLLNELSAADLNDREILFQKARASYYMARAYQALDTVAQVIEQDRDLRRGKFKRIQSHLDRLDDIVTLYEQSLAYSDEYLNGGRDGRGVRMNAEALSQLTTLKTLGFLISSGPKIEPLAEEAVTLNPGEIKAHMLLASRYVYSPGIWGGDPEKGIEMLNEIQAMPGADREDLHNIQIGIGFALTMMEQWPQAAAHFRSALEYYPGNVYARALLELCESGGPS